MQKDIKQVILKYYMQKDIKNTKFINPKNRDALQKPENPCVTLTE